MKPVANNAFTNVLETGRQPIHDNESRLMVGMNVRNHTSITEETKKEKNE